MKKIFTFFMALMACTIMSVAQIVTTSPEILQESSKNVVLTYHADQGSKGLAGLSSSTPMYAHIGVMTNLSPSTWTHVVADWGVNLDKAKMQYVGPDTWSLNIGDIRTYFGITNPNEHVQKIAIVFRDATGSKEGKTASGGDIFVDVQEDGFALQFSANVDNIVTKPTNVTFTAVTSESSTITITVNGTQIAQQSGVTKLTGNYNISATGSYQVVATANNGKETISQTINMAYPKPSSPGTYPGGVPKMGTTLNADGSVTFCLAAPGKEGVIIVPSWDDYQVLDKNSMLYQDYGGYRYFFITINGLEKGKNYPYYYVVDGSSKVADPYARMMLDPWNDKWMQDLAWEGMPQYPYERFDDVMLAVYNSNFFENNFKFSNFTIPDHNNLIIYELLLRDFTGTEGQANGDGTLRKAGQKLDYLASLGVNAIELMPVMEFGGNNSWGYNTNGYFALDKCYGSPDDLKNFVQGCHDRGMAVILDIVFNQADGLHPWYQMYPASNNPFFNQTAPHDYSVFNDWKQEYPLVLQHEKDVLQFWMKEYNVDGYRFDLVKGLGTSYPNGTESYNKTRVERMKALQDAIKAVKPNGIHINENLAGSQEENEMAAYGQLNWANKNYSACQYAMGYGSGSNMTVFYAPNDSRTWGSTVSYGESHDEERMGYKQKQFGASGVKGNHVNSMKRLGQTAVQMLMIPGPKMIWQFGELGADQTTKKSDGGNDTDPKTVIWSYLDDADRKALHDTYAAMAHFRTHNPDLFDNKATVTFTGFGDNVTSNRIIRVTSGDGQKEVMAFINTRIGGANNTASATSTKLNASNSQLITAHKDFNGTLNGAGTTVSVSLPPHGYAVYATTNTAGVSDIVADDSTSNVNVEGGYGEIIVNGDYSEINVFDLSGRIQPSTGLTPGLYIVKVDNATYKVTVK